MASDLRIRSRWAGRAVPRVVAWVAPALMAACAVLIAASTLRMIVACVVPAPIQDQWAQLVGLRPVTLSWLVSQHNEHRLLFPRLVFVADRWIAAETGAFSLGVSVILQAGLAALLAILGRRAGVRPGAAFLAVVAGLVALLFWAVQYENQTWPFQVQFYCVLLAATGCFAAVAGRTTTSAAVAAVLGFVAAFSLASGVLVLILATVMALWLRRTGRDLAVLSLAAAGTLVAYLSGYQTPSGHMDPWQALRKPVALAAYVLAELGAPFGNALRQLTGQPNAAVAIALGAAGGIAFAACACAVHRRQPRPRAAAALVAAGSFVVGMAGLTSIGRLDLGITSAAASRYTTASLLFWACLLLLATALLPRARTVMAAITAALLGIAVLTQPRFVAIADQLAADRTLALPALAARVGDEALIRPIYPDAAEPLSLWETELSTRTGVFARPWAQWIGTPLRDHVAMEPAARCAGRFSRATRIEDASYPGWRVEGTVRAPSRSRRPMIVLTGPDGRVDGYGVGDAGTTTLEAGGPAGTLPRDGWAGALATVPPEAAAAFVLLDGNTAACPLENAPAMENPVMAELSGPAPQGTPPGGAVDAVTISDFVELNGWGLIQGGTGMPLLLIDTNLPVHSIEATTAERPDAAAAMHDPRLRRSGFHIIMTLDGARPLPAHPIVCVWSKDSIYGAHRLSSAPGFGGKGAICPG
jgi:hypothetical protein